MVFQTVTHSVDSFCSERCNEREVYFVVNGDYRCLCDAGFVPEDCALGTTVTTAILDKGLRALFIGCLLVGE